MDRLSKTNLSNLQSALEDKQWDRVRALLGTVPTSPPEGANAMQIVNSIELARVTIDTLAQAVDFGVSFNAAYAACDGLLEAGVIPYATALLRAFSSEERIVSRVSTLFTHLATSNKGRIIIGGEGAVDVLATIWRSHLTCVPVVTALVALTPAHVDNVSRAMRRRAISTAIFVLSRFQFTRNNRALLEVTVQLTSMCAICTPDQDSERASLVPTLLTVTRRAVETRAVSIASHAIMALANIFDCHIKEGDGYEIIQPSAVVETILETWSAFPNDHSLGSAASWAVTALVNADNGALQYAKTCAPRIERLMAGWDAHATPAFLRNLICFKSSKFCRYSARRKNKGLSLTGDAVLSESTHNLGNFDNAVETVQQKQPSSPQHLSVIGNEDQPFGGLSDIAFECSENIVEGSNQQHYVAQSPSPEHSPTRQRRSRRTSGAGTSHLQNTKDLTSMSQPPTVRKRHVSAVLQSDEEEADCTSERFSSDRASHDTLNATEPQRNSKCAPRSRLKKDCENGNIKDGSESESVDSLNGDDLKASSSDISCHTDMGFVEKPSLQDGSSGHERLSIGPVALFCDEDTKMSFAVSEGNESDCQIVDSDDEIPLSAHPKKSAARRITTNLKHTPDFTFNKLTEIMLEPLNRISPKFEEVNQHAPSTYTVDSAVIEIDGRHGTKRHRSGVQARVYPNKRGRK